MFQWKKCINEDKSIPSCLDVVAKTDDNEVMAVAHKEYEIYGG